MAANSVSTIVSALREVLPSHAPLPPAPAAIPPLADGAPAAAVAARDAQVADAAVAHAAACAAVRAETAAILWESSDGAAVAAADAFVRVAPTAALSAMCTILNIAGPLGSGFDAAAMVADCRIRVSARLALLRGEAALARSADEAARAQASAAAAKAAAIADAKTGVRNTLRLTAAASLVEAFEVTRDAPDTRLAEAVLLCPEGVAWLALAHQSSNFREHAAAMLLRFLDYPERADFHHGAAGGGGLGDGSSSQSTSVIKLPAWHAERARRAIMTMSASAVSSMLGQVAGLTTSGTVTALTMLTAAIAMASVDGRREQPTAGARIVITAAHAEDIRAQVDNGLGMWITKGTYHADGVVFGDIGMLQAAVAQVDFKILPPVGAIVRIPYSRDGAIDTRGATRFGEKLAIVVKLMQFLRNLIDIHGVRRDDLESNVHALKTALAGGIRMTRDAVNLAESACTAAGRAMPPFSQEDEYNLVSDFLWDLLLHSRRISIAACSAAFMDASGGEPGFLAVQSSGRRTFPVLYLDPVLVAEAQRAREVAFQRSLTFQVAAAHQSTAPQGPPPPPRPPPSPPTGGAGGGAGGGGAYPAKNEQGSRFVSLGAIRDPTIKSALGGGAAPPMATSARVPTAAVAAALASATTPAPPGAAICFSQFIKDHATCKMDGQPCPRVRAGGRRLHHIDASALPALAATVEWYESK